MLKFLKGTVDVLVCTTIIESRHRRAECQYAHRQPRGPFRALRPAPAARARRFTHKAYAYFIIPPRKQLSAQAKSRIDAIEKHSGPGRGFSRSPEDLQIRGAGNILGQEQHGYIATIGFDLYAAAS